MSGATILFSEMRPDISWEHRFNDWYQNDHIPARMVLDGWLGAQRYTAEDNPDYLVIYDIESEQALSSPEYAKVKNDPSEETKWMLKNVTNFTRYIGSEIGAHGASELTSDAPVIFTALFNVPEENAAEFDEWMSEDHIPALLQCEDWLAIRRFSLSLSEPNKYTRLSIHFLRSPAALSSQERKTARETPFRRRMARHDWFNEGMYRQFNKYQGRYKSLL
jgi:hypothetical protein